jgi:hypothetical protein
MAQADPRPRDGGARSTGVDTDALSMLSSLLTETKAPAAAVVSVQPDDTVDTVAAKAFATGASSVQLIIPPGIAEFQSHSSFSTLRVLLEGARISITAVSADPQIVAAARRGRVETLGVEAAPRPRETKPLPEAQDDNRARYAALDDADADLYSSFDDLSDAIQTTAPTRRSADADAALAAQIDDLTDAPLRPTQPAYSRGMTGDRRANRRADTAAGSGARTVGRPTRTGGVARRRRSSSISAPLLILAAIALIALVAAIWYFASRTSVQVALPPAASSEQTFSGEVIPYSADGSTPNAAAVQAAPVVAEAEFTATGQVAGETLTPIGRAQGIVTIVNTIPQAVTLPEGTDLIATNADGREVRFALDVPAVVPAAVTVSDLTGQRTTYGSIDVAVTARSPGSQSNVAQDAISQVLIPGQQPIVSDRSNFIIRHPPIGGGDEQMLRIVTEEDVRRALGEALTGLYNIGVQRLRAQIDEQQFAVDPNTIHPSPADLATPAGYDEPIITPPVGQPADENGNFSVTVRARFSALATPSDRLVGVQLQEVVPQYFTQRPVPPCPASAQPGFSVTSWRWDGSRLAIDGSITCTAERTLPPEALAEVRAALVGQSRDAADARMRELQERGVIGEYTLPAVDNLPGFDWLIEIQVVPPALAQP